MTKYEERLSLLAAYLEKEWRTANEIADMFRICKVAAYKRVMALPRHGFRLSTMKVRRGRSGPESNAWRVLTTRE
jgi:hypothetical protein